MPAPTATHLLCPPKSETWNVSDLGAQHARYIPIGRYGRTRLYKTPRHRCFLFIHFHLLSFMFSFRFFLFLSFCHVVFGSKRGLLDRRAQGVQPVRIPLNVNDVRQYSLNLAMSSGANVQNLPFSISTSTGYTMVAGNTCDSCGVQSYDPSASSSVQETSNTGQVSLWSSATSGNLVKEDCQLTRANGSPWAYANQSIIVANQSQTIVPSYGYSGVIGLGTNGRDGKFNETLAGNWLSQHPESSNFTYGLALNGPHSPTDGGEMHLLAPDPSAFTGDITWLPMTAFNSNASDADFYIDMDSWVFQSSGGGQLRQSKVHAIVDPFLAPLRFPSAQARSIFSTVQGAQSHPNPNTSATNVWDVPCDAKMTLTFTFNGYAVSLDESVLVRQAATGHCISTVEEWIDTSVSEYALGSVFISAIYMIFSVSGPSQGSVGLVPRAQSSTGISAGAIAGITIGVVALVVVLVIGCVMLYRLHRAKVAKAAEGAQPDFSTGPAATPYIYSIEPHETTTLMPMTPSTAGISLSPYRPISTHYYRDVTESSTQVTTEYSESSSGLDSPPPYAGGSANRIGNLPLRVVSVGPPPTKDRKGRGTSVS
ncbi:acid protease [Hymenopellis radicata]|nr:acid protease [Hymenopellis radicata]